MMRALIAAALSAGALLCWTPTAAAADVCGDLGGTVEPDGLCRTHVDDPAYILDLTFPVDYPDQQAVTEFITTTRDGFIDDASAPDARNLPHGLDVHTIPEGTDTTRSVTFEVYQNGGGAHPTTWYKSFNFDLAAQRPITFDTLFAPDSMPLNSILPVVQRELSARTGQPDLVFGAAGLDPANYQNFAITPYDVIFYFDRGALMPAAAGAQKVYVQRSAIPPLAV